jgi:excinuclease ABC subunit C
VRGEDEGAEPYVAKTANLRRRLARLLAAPDESGHTRRLSLRAQARTVEYTVTGSDFESNLVLYGVLRALFPANYRERLRLRPAPLVKLNLDNPYPRAHVTRRIGRLGGKSLYYGPFPTRAAAEKFLNDALDLFKMRRCDFDLNPDPAFPGCVYSEMKMCLAPCFQGCSDEEYRQEVARVNAFLDSGGQSLVRELGAAREQASERLEFEQAAALHGRVDKTTSVVKELPEIVRRLDQWRGVVVQRSAQPECVDLFPIEGGRVAPAVAFSVAPQPGKGVSMEARLVEALGQAAAPGKGTAGEVMEHLALLRRWYYKRSRQGELFLADARGDLPLRRLVRGVSRVFRGEREEESGDRAIGSSGH